MFDDIQGALNAQMSAILVQTGKYRQNDELKIKSSFHVAQNFAQAVDHILNNC